MISAKHFEPILVGLLAGAQISVYREPDSKVCWYIPRVGSYAFAVIEPEPFLNPSLTANITGMKDILKQYEEIDDGCLFSPSGVTRTLGKTATVVELLNKTDARVWVQKNYLQLFPPKEYQYFQTAGKPLSPLFCQNKGTTLLEGLILPFNLKND